MFSFRGCAAMVLALGAAAACAQSEYPGGLIPRAEVAFNYSYMRANAAPGNCGCFNLNGGGTETALHTYRNFSVVFDLTGERAGGAGAAGQSLSLLSYTAGPRFSYPLRRARRVQTTPFVQGLFGAVHGFDGQFPKSSGAISTSATDAAFLVGGGLDLGLSRRLALRLAQVDYGLDRLPNNVNNRENLLRVSAGVALRLR
jgi:outer membrane immunogenic protein